MKYGDINRFDVFVSYLFKTCFSIEMINKYLELQFNLKFDRLTTKNFFLHSLAELLQYRLLRSVVSTPSIVGLPVYFFAQFTFLLGNFLNQIVFSVLKSVMGSKCWVSTSTI